MPTLTPGLATHQPVQCERGASNSAVLFKRQKAIGRTGGFKSAGVAKPGTKHQAIRFDQTHQGISRQTPNDHLHAAHAATVCDGLNRVAPCIKTSNSAHTAFFSATDEALG